MLTVCVSLRYCWYRDVGKYSLHVGRPRIYLWKHFFHACITLCLLGIFVLMAVKLNLEDNRDLKIARLTVTAVQFIMWVLSAVILRFEYRRALGHVWYMHPLFVWFSVVVYAADLLYSFKWANC